MKRTRRSAGDHPDEEDLLRYRAGELPEAAARRCQDHLVECRACRDQLLLGSQTGAPDVADFGAVPAWRAMRRRIRRERWQIPVAAAAALLLAALGLTTKIHFDLESMVTRLSQPQLNVVVHDLVPKGDQVRDAAGTDGALEIAPGVDVVTFILRLEVPEGTGPEDLRVEIRDAGGRTVWRAGGLEVKHGTATLGVSRHFLDNGDYEVLVYSDNAQPSRLLEEYEVTMRFATGAAEAPR